MQIVLVAIHPYQSPQSVPLANGFLKAFVSELPITINLVDFYLQDKPETCADQIIAMAPDAVGFSCYVWNQQQCCNIAARIKEIFPQLTIFSGGPETTAAPDQLLSSGYFDLAIIGEGEIPFKQLCQELLTGVPDFSHIPGVMITGTPHPPVPVFLSNLDEIPSPYLNETIVASGTPGLLWQLSRGCAFTCTFCYDARGVNGVRHFSLARLENELRLFATSGVSQIFVLDSTFNMDMKRAKSILRMIRNYAPDIHFHFEVRCEFLDRELAQLFAEIPCSLQIGLQSSDPLVLNNVGRSFNKKDFTTKVNLLNHSGAVFGFDLIYGLPGDTLAGFTASLDYALSLYPNHLDIFPLSVLPGTQLAEQSNAFNMKWLHQPPYTLLSHQTFPAADLVAASELGHACDIFYTRGKAVAWFNAITSVCGFTSAEFLRCFSGWLIQRHGKSVTEAELDDKEIFDLQVLFLRHICTGKTGKYLPLILDLVRYHHHYAAVLLINEESLPDSVLPTDLLHSNARLAPAARLLDFSYDIEQLLACGEPRIAWMYDHIPQAATDAVVYRSHGIVYTEVLAPPYAQLLRQIIDKTLSPDLKKAGLNFRQAEEFISFAYEEQILISG